MIDVHEVPFGQDFLDSIEDEDGPVDLSAAGGVALQRRIDCGVLSESVASVTTPASGGVTVAAGIPVGHYQFRWKYTIGAETFYDPPFQWNELVVRDVDACNTFGLFLQKIRDNVFPEGEAENLKFKHRDYVLDGLIDLQQKVPGLRYNHTDRHFVADTYFECGATVIDAPKGFISRVYVTTADCCYPIDADPIDHEDMVCLLKDNQQCGPVATPYTMYLDGGEYVSYPDYGCLYYGDASGSIDRLGRPCKRKVSMHRGLMYVFPYLQSTEILVIEWDGVKREFKDTEPIPAKWNRELEDAVETYLAAKVAQKEDCDAQKTAVERAAYADLVAKLIWQDRKEASIPRRAYCFSNCN